MGAGTRPPQPGPRPGARGPRPGMRGQLGAVNGPRPTASWALGVCDHASQTGSQTQTRTARPAAAGRINPGQLGPRAARWGHTFRDQGPWPTGPGSAQGRAGRPGPAGLLLLYVRDNVQLGGPGSRGRKKNRPEGRSARPSWAELRENESRYKVQQLARLRLEFNAISGPLD